MSQAPADLHSLVQEYLHELHVLRQLSPHTLKAYRMDLSELQALAADRSAVVMLSGADPSLVPEALAMAGMPDARFIKLKGETPPYDTRCLWKTERDLGARGAFLAVVRERAASAS